MAGARWPRGASPGCLLWRRQGCLQPPWKSRGRAAGPRWRRGAAQAVLMRFSLRKELKSCCQSLSVNSAFVLDRKPRLGAQVIVLQSSSTDEATKRGAAAAPSCSLRCSCDSVLPSLETVISTGSHASFPSCEQFPAVTLRNHRAAGRRVDRNSAMDECDKLGGLPVDGL